MGYISECAFLLAINDKLADELERYELWISGEGYGSIKKNIDKCFDTFTENESYLEWHSDWVKWYGSYPEVAWLERFMDWLDSKELEDYYQFLRIGERFEDVDNRGGLCVYHIRRSFEPC